MFPANFDYALPATLDEAIDLLTQHGEEAKILAGGHSLIPAMKLRLAQPKILVDLRRVAQLDQIRRDGSHVSIGAMATHDAIERSSVLAEACPLLPMVAAEIGDVQVRNKGTIGGSLAHADPAADWPAAALALEAEMEIAGPGGSRRRVGAEKFFVDMLQTALRPNEVLVAVHVPVTGNTVAYVKTAQKASGFALCGVAAWIDRGRRRVRVGVTGVSAKPFRAESVERELESGEITADTIASAAGRVGEGVEPLGDIHASGEFRLHLARVNTIKALTAANRA